MEKVNDKMGNQVSNYESVEVKQWQRTYESIKTTHDLAYVLIQEAITLEEQEKPQEVIFLIYFSCCVYLHNTYFVVILK